MIIEVVSYYWPRLLVALWFALTNTGITARNGNKKHLFRNFIIMFFIAGTTVAIINECVTEYVFRGFIKPAISFMSVEQQLGLELVFKCAVDAASYIIPTYIFTRIIGEKWKVGATVYLMYVIIDRLCILIAPSPLAYFIMIILVLIVGIALFAKKMQFVVDKTEDIEWVPVLHYQFGMFSFMMHFTGHI